MTEAENSERRHSLGWVVRIAILCLGMTAILTVFLTNRYLTDRFTETTRNRAELRLALYSGNLLAELRQNAIVPQLLARDPALIGALNSNDFQLSTQRLLSFGEELGAAALFLMDLEGRIVAATDRSKLGENFRNQPVFVEAIRASETLFTVTETEARNYAFAYSRAVTVGSETLGVIAVEVDLQRYERAWAGITDALLVADSEGTIVLATEPRWRGRTEVEALVTQDPQGAIERAVRATADWTSLPPDAYLQGEAVMRLDARIPFQGWKMVSFTSYASVRERVNGVLALEIMGFALLLALTFYAMNRRSKLRVAFFQQESEQLRHLNVQLQREIAERKRVQEDLAVAEQTLEQSSKLAALGEMSAAVSHELNQPLAAMKTYLAGARLLLKRSRADEALASFGRIDDLIERMGKITRQLKSYARKGSQTLRSVDLEDCIASSLSLMEPQLRERRVQINRILPGKPVLVVVDKMRIEQVMVNLLRNALDATKAVHNPQIDVILSVGETAVLTVRDNGPGIEDLDQLFEPFYTTKPTGDGVGLGLAISSGIVNDLGGRLTARNGRDGGAVFELQLPIFGEIPNTTIEAAE